MKALWTPDDKSIQQSQMRHFMDKVGSKVGLCFNDYEQFYQWSIQQTQEFWSLWWDEAGIICNQKGEHVLTEGKEFYQAEWFKDAELNFAENLLRFRDDNTALIGTDELGEIRSVSYKELFLKVAAMSSAMKKHGVTTGDRVAGYMPNIIETVVAMLATTSLGAIWSSCSPDFGIHGVLDRFSQIKPKLLISTNGYIYNGKTLDNLEKISQIKEAIDSIQKIVIVNYVQMESDFENINDAISWNDFIDLEAKEIDFVRTTFNHPLYIMYSSGTTGKPKCIVHGVGGTLLQHTKEHLLHADLTRDDVLFFFTTCGWMMWNWLASALYTGCQLVLYDGSPFAPVQNKLLDLIDQQKITVFGTSAKYISVLKKEGLKPKTSHDLSSVRTILSTGSPLLPGHYDYVYKDVKSDVLLGSISGGTDIISCFAIASPINAVYSGQLQCRGLGMAVEIYDECGNSVQGEKGELVCIKPFPSMPTGFWNDDGDSKYHEAYFERFPGVWAQGDFAELTPENGMIIYGRSDTTLNPGGVRIGTAEIYQQVDKVEEVIEALAIAQKWEDDIRIVLFVVLNMGIKLDENLIKHIKLTIRKNATPRHVPAKIVAVPDFPRTLSGKIAEQAVQKCVHNEDIKNKDALINPQILDLYKELAKTELSD